jgi:hypothetical protein
MLLGSQFCLLKFMSIKTASLKPGTFFFARDLVSAPGGGGGGGGVPARGEGLSGLESLMIETFSEILS